MRTTIVGAVNVLATYYAALLWIWIHSCGRKSLILWSSGGMFLSCVVTVLSLLGYFNNMLALLVAVNVYVIFFEFGLGRLIVAEIVDGKYIHCGGHVRVQSTQFIGPATLLLDWSSFHR